MILVISMFFLGRQPPPEKLFTPTITFFFQDFRLFKYSTGNDNAVDKCRCPRIIAFES